MQLCGGDEDKDKMFILRTHLWCRYIHVTDIVYFDGTWRRSLGSPAGTKPLHSTGFCLRFGKGKTACVSIISCKHSGNKMESQSMQTASSYINNLLLARGLLRNGIPIEFVAPPKVEGAVNLTMTKVMNLVHDMILRRDVRYLSISLGVVAEN